MTMVWRASVLALLLALAAISPASTQEELAGVASVIDGDTIEIRGQRIRLRPASSSYQTIETRVGRVQMPAPVRYRSLF
jgi:endonuclease YncB( thermonuclease family)